jgi:hypothetical protein
LSNVNNVKAISDIYKNSTYTACRRKGMTAHDALERVHYINRVLEGLKGWDQGESIHWELGNNECWFKETPEGRYEVSYDLDPDVDSDAHEDYPAELQLAYNNDQWYFWSVAVVFIGKDGRVGETGMGGIDAGEAFKTLDYPLDEPQQVYAVAIDYYKLDQEARELAKLGKPDPSLVARLKAQGWTPEQINAELAPDPTIHPSWEYDESLAYDPMNVVGVAGYVWKYDDDECQHVFSRGEGDDEKHMLGEPIPGGINLMLGGNFFNRILVTEHATADGFLKAFTAKWEELVSEHYDED